MLEDLPLPGVREDEGEGDEASDKSTKTASVTILQRNAASSCAESENCLAQLRPQMIQKYGLDEAGVEIALEAGVSGLGFIDTWKPAAYPTMIFSS